MLDHLRASRLLNRNQRPAERLVTPGGSDEIPVAGVLTGVRRCSRGRSDDIDRNQSPWNRRARRRRAKKLGMR